MLKLIVTQPGTESQSRPTRLRDQRRAERLEIISRQARKRRPIWARGILTGGLPW